MENERINEVNNMELFFDVLDESTIILHEIFHKPYFELLEMSVNNILEGDITCNIEKKEDYDRLKETYLKLKDIDFTVEDIRKAFQSITLRGLKEMRIPNGVTTPDTIGIFFSYIVSKVIDKKEFNLLDPLCGTGNLLITMANYIDKDIKLFACDNDSWMCKITKMLADLTNNYVEIFMQDTFQLTFTGMDVITFDMPHSEKEDNNYFPYQAILHYKEMLNNEGLMIGLVENDFFDYDKDKKFKEELIKDMSILGILELPDEMFKTSKPKIILILYKKKIDELKPFMVKLPSFKDVKLFNEALLDIEAWFEKNKKVLKENN